MKKLAFILLIASLATTAVFAASDSWKTTAGTGNWNTGSNWVGGLNPGNGTITGSYTDIATFGGTSNFPSVTLSSDGRNISGLREAENFTVPAMRRTHEFQKEDALP